MLAGVDEDRRGPGGVGCAEMPRARAAVVRAAEVVWRKERRVVMRDQGSGIRDQGSGSLPILQVRSAEAQSSECKGAVRMWPERHPR